MAQVTVYTSSTCPYCIFAKNFLKQHQVAFTEKNVSTDPQARNELIARGHTGVPILVIDGTEVVGFDQQKIVSLLGL